MASKFHQIEIDLKQIEEDLNYLLKFKLNNNEIKSVEFGIVEENNKLSNQLNKRLKALSKLIEKYVRTAKIQDQNLRLYSDSMIKRVLNLESELNQVNEKAIECLNLQSNEHKNRVKSEEVCIIGDKQKKNKEEIQQCGNKTRSDKNIISENKDDEIKKIEDENARILANKKKAEEAEKRRRILEDKRRKADEEAKLRYEQAQLLSLEQAIELLESNTSEKDFNIAIQALYLIMLNISKEPSKIEYRQLRKKNEALNHDIFRHFGGYECLISLGFREEEEGNQVDNEEIDTVLNPNLHNFLILEEPSLEDVALNDLQLDQYENIKEQVNYLDELIRNMPNRY